MEIFTVYDHPIDFPDHFVVRRFVVTTKSPFVPIPDEDIFLKHKDLEWIRNRLLHCGLICTPRHENDDEKIIESWI
jgi:hypothetical protein